MPCRACEKMRAAFGSAWRRVTRGCIVQGCRDQGPVCRRHWNAMPSALRSRWLDEIDYSGRWPSKELSDDVNRALKGAPTFTGL